VAFEDEAGDALHEVGGVGGHRGSGRRRGGAPISGPRRPQVASTEALIAVIAVSAGRKGALVTGDAGAGQVASCIDQST
jgi:hypothetical protein